MTSEAGNCTNTSTHSHTHTHPQIHAKAHAPWMLRAVPRGKVTAITLPCDGEEYEAKRDASQYENNADRCSSDNGVELNAARKASV